MTSGAIEGWNRSGWTFVLNAL